MIYTGTGSARFLESFTLTVATKLVDTCASSGFSPSLQTCLYPIHQHTATTSSTRRGKKQKDQQPVQKAQEQPHSSGSYYLIRQLLYSQGASEFWLRDQHQQQQQEQIAAGEMMEMMSDDSHVNMSDISSNWHGLEIYPLDVSTEDDLLLSINTSSSNRPPSPIESLLGKSKSYHLIFLPIFSYGDHVQGQQIYIYNAKVSVNERGPNHLANHRDKVSI